MLMQESIKEVINIHKCKFFFSLKILRACGPARADCGLARAGRRPMRAKPVRACGLTILARPAFFLRACGWRYTSLMIGCLNSLRV